MTLLLALLFSFSLNAQSINKVYIEDLNLDYVAPLGKGSLVKLNLGFGNMKQMAPYPVEVSVQEEAIFVLSPVAEITWEDYPKFLLDIDKLGATHLNASVSKKEHYLKAYDLTFRPKKNQLYGLNGVNLKCIGNSASKDLIQRVFDDCRESLEGSVSKMNGPLMRYILDVLSDPPNNLVEEIAPKDLEVSIKNGQIFLNLAVKFIITARARVWGEVFYENDYKTIAIRVDQIKYGIIPVTRIVLSQLRSRVKHPQVTVTPPWIRIHLQEQTK